MKNSIEEIFKILNKFLIQTKGQKRLFLFLGIINMIITNLFLQVFLRLNFIPTSIATLASQLINMFLGYIIYSKFVFKRNDLLIKKVLFKYLLLMIILWLTNFNFIYILGFFGFTRNISALILIPFLALISFIIQKYFVFKKNL